MLFYEYFANLAWNIVRGRIPIPTYLGNIDENCTKLQMEVRRLREAIEAEDEGAQSAAILASSDILDPMSRTERKRVFGITQNRDHSGDFAVIDRHFQRG
ncbi:MAG: hypothetical protein NVSMB39_7020 [Candidatus Saccharimonadales bacterium]